VRGLLVDLDRTLVDVQSFTDYGAALVDLETRFGELPSSRVPATYWRSATLRAMEVLVAWAGDPRWQEASELVEAHELAAVEASRPMPGVERFVAAIAGIPTVVVTLMGPAAARAALDRHGIDLPVVGRRVELRPKPAPDQLVAAAELVGVAVSACTMVGDSSWDHEAAVAAGAGFVGVGSTDFPPGVPVAADLVEALSLLGFEA